jgi:hypothetical protein
MIPAWLDRLTRTVRGAFGSLPSGLEPFELDAGTEQLGGLTLPARRCYPLRALPDGRKPQITSRHKLNNPERSTHYGVDFFYRWQAGDAAMRIGDGGRTAKWFIPDATFAIAASDGIVTLAGSSKTGHRVWVQHAGGVYTGYFHMTQIFVKAGDAVKMSEPIGIVGDNPADTDARHLHWELYSGPLAKYPKGTLDPERFLRGASVLAAAG